jgi:hypothetical protein
LFAPIIIAPLIGAPVFARILDDAESIQTNVQLKRQSM